MITRREFLGNVLTLPALLALIEAESAQADSVFDPDFYPGLAPAYPDPARTAVIDQWLSLTEEGLQRLEKFWELLAEARSLPPSRVDVVSFYDSLEEARQAIETLDHEFDHGSINTDDLLETLTGQPIDALTFLWADLIAEAG